MSRAEEYQVINRQAEEYRAAMAARGCSARALARLQGLAQPTLARTLAMLKLPEDLRTLVERGELSPWTAVELARNPDPSVRADLAERVTRGEMKREECLKASRLGCPKVRRRKARGPAPAVATCPVTLRGPGETVTVGVLELPRLDETTYDAVNVLVQAWPKSVTKEDLEAARHKGGRHRGAEEPQAPEGIACALGLPHRDAREGMAWGGLQDHVSAIPRELLET